MPAIFSYISFALSLFAIATFLFNYFAFKDRVATTVRSFFDVINSEKFNELRAILAELYKSTKTDGDEELSVEKRLILIDVESKENKAAIILLNYFNMWGLLVKKRHLPLWALYGQNKIHVQRMYSWLFPIIQHRRNGGSKYYAMYFTWMYNKLNSKTHNRRNNRETKGILG